MTTRQVSENELITKGIQCVAVASLELDGIKYSWLTAYPQAMQTQIEQRARSLRVKERATLLVVHANGNVSVWQGPVGTATPPAEPEAPSEPPVATRPQQPATGSTIRYRGATAAAPEPGPKPQQEPQTITIRYRGRTITKVVGAQKNASPDDRSGSGEQRNYRGNKY